MKKKYPIKPTEKQLNIMSDYWRVLQDKIDKFESEVNILAENMSKEIGIPELEFFRCDNDFCGIGNYDRTLKLIQREELEKQ